MPRRDVQQGSACARACVHAHACEGGVGILGRVAREASPGRRHLSQDLKERREQAARWPAGRSTANGAGARAPRGHRARHVRHEGAGGTEGVGRWEGGQEGAGGRCRLIRTQAPVPSHFPSSAGCHGSRRTEHPSSPWARPFSGCPPCRTSRLDC